jgi:two-component system cell cycle response regulator CpdR
VPSLLYVEDDELLMLVISMALEDAGFEVTEASNGQEAIDLLARHDGFDYVVSDISMPGGITGSQVADAAQAARADCRIVLASGYARSQLPPLNSAARFLEKPYHVQDLLALLAE